jgi:hypothetical protein
MAAWADSLDEAKAAFRAAVGAAWIVCFLNDEVSTMSPNTG